mmetsp:Transcript_85198/g.227266  ORF Transcript_85198/g.227266 Transcript_85198/m.227266 type:complete len:146 (+) Transcript_85198:72-509(+)
MSQGTIVYFSRNSEARKKSSWADSISSPRCAHRTSRADGSLTDADKFYMRLDYKSIHGAELDTAPVLFDEVDKDVWNFATTVDQKRAYQQPRVASPVVALKRNSSEALIGKDFGTAISPNSKIHVANGHVKRVHWAPPVEISEMC